MDNVSQHIEDLIAKHLAHETTPGEMLELEAWLNEDETNRVYYDKIESLFLDNRGSDFEIDTENDWQIVKEEIGKAKPVFKLNAWYYAVAAMLILGITGYLFLNKPNDIVAVAKPLSIKTTSEIITDTLPDGTIVTLNKNSELKTAADYNITHRIVELKGEACFEVVKSQAAPFIIKTDKGEIRDIGTSFTVNTVSDTVLNINVTQGEIQLKTNTKQVINARAGQQLVYNTKTHQNRIIEINPNAQAFKTHSFEFKNNSLKNIVTQLNEVYDQRITYNSALEDCPLTVTFKNEKIETILDIIAETLQVKYEKRKEGFHLAGNKCN